MVAARIDFFSALLARPLVPFRSGAEVARRSADAASRGSGFDARGAHRRSGVASFAAVFPVAPRLRSRGEFGTTFSPRGRARRCGLLLDAAVPKLPATPV